jgi:AP-1 complex subunit sigma 1/2
MIEFLLLLSRQGKLRLAKWYGSYGLSERQRIVREVSAMVIGRGGGGGGGAFRDYSGLRLVSRRYASLYFVAGCDGGENELLVLEAIHRYVEVLDRYFENVCELDLIFNYHRAHYLLDEYFMAGEVQEPSMRAVLRAVSLAEEQEAEESGGDRRVW